MSFDYSLFLNGPDFHLFQYGKNGGLFIGFIPGLNRNSTISEMQTLSSSSVIGISISDNLPPQTLFVSSISKAETFEGLGADSSKEYDFREILKLCWATNGDFYSIHRALSEYFELKNKQTF